MVPQHKKSVPCMDLSLHYRDYYWKEGIPYGLGRIETPDGNSFKIVMDPYRKRISIEKYDKNLRFVSVVYDSAMLDFRHLKPPAEHMAWQKVVLEESPEKIVCLIRNQDDRLLFEETHLFEKHLCRECRVVSPHGIVLSTHNMLYTHLGDHLNGAILYDITGRPVMYKRYEADEQDGEFTTLIEEVWDMHQKDLTQWQKSPSIQKA